MVNKALTVAEIQTLALGDMHLVSIEWTGETSPNLLIVLSRKTHTASHLFTWVKNLRVSLDLSRRFRPLTWEVTFACIQRDGWQVQLDFAHDGVIEFECQEIISDPDRS